MRCLKLIISRCAMAWSMYAQERPDAPAPRPWAPGAFQPAGNFGFAGPPQAFAPGFAPGPFGPCRPGPCGVVGPSNSMRPMVQPMGLNSGRPVAPCTYISGAVSTRPPPQLPAHWGAPLQTNVGRDPLLSQAQGASGETMTNQPLAHEDRAENGHHDDDRHHELAIVKSIEANPWRTFARFKSTVCFCWCLFQRQQRLNCSWSKPHPRLSQGFFFGGFACLASCFLFITVLLLAGVRILDPRPNDIVPVILREPWFLNPYSLRPKKMTIMSCHHSSDLPQCFLGFVFPFLARSVVSNVATRVEIEEHIAKKRWAENLAPEEHVLLRVLVRGLCHRAGAHTQA